MPRVAKIYEGGNSTENMNTLMIKVGRFMCLVNGLIVVGFSILGKQFITLWMGKDFLPAYYGILLVIIPGFFYNPLEIAHSAMIMKKKVKLQAVVSLSTGVINVILSLFLSYLFGAVGAALSICIAYSFRAIIYHIIHHKVMCLNMLRFIRQCYLKLIIPVSLTFFVGFIMNLLPFNAGWSSFVVKGFCVVVTYLICCFIFYSNRNERLLVLNKLTRK